MGKSQGNLPHQFHAAQMLFLPITFNYPLVQSIHYSTVNFRVHTSVTFLINSDKRSFLMGCFLKCLETSPFCWRWFCRCAINRLGHAFNTKHFYKWHSDSEDLFGLQLRGCYVLFRKLQRHCFCFVSFAHTQSTSESKSAYFYLLCMRIASKSGFGKFWHKSFSYSQGKS